MADEQPSLDLGQLGIRATSGQQGVLGAAKPGQLHKQGQRCPRAVAPFSLAPSAPSCLHDPMQVTAPSSLELGELPGVWCPSPRWCTEATGLRSRLPALPNPGGSQGPVPSPVLHRGRPGRVSSIPGPPGDVQVSSRFVEPLSSPGCRTLPHPMPACPHFPAACRLPSFCCT